MRKAVKSISQTFKMASTSVTYLRSGITRLLLPQLRTLATFSNSAEDVGIKELPSKMSAWQINSFTGLSSLKLAENLEVPSISQPNEVLIEVKAASINSLDVAMTEGYGHELFDKVKKIRPENIVKASSTSYLPLTLGRDFSGIVRAIGGDVKHLKLGDKVMGVISPPFSGSHAQYVVASASNVKLKPENLTMEEAATIPYAGLTAWSALSLTAELCLGSEGKKVLVLGATGGVGTIAVQLLKAWGATVVSSGSADSTQYLLDLGADFVVDHNSPDAQYDLHQFGGFDVILDCTGKTTGFSHDLLKPWTNAKYVTLSPPTLRNFDDRGIVGGLVKSGIDLLAANSSAILEGKTLRWAYFVPSSQALTSLCDLARDHKLKAVIDSVYPYEKLPDAYAKMKTGHKKGKIIVQM